MPDPYQQDVSQLNQAITKIGAQITEFKEGVNTKQAELNARLLETEQKLASGRHGSAGGGRAAGRVAGRDRCEHGTADRHREAKRR